MNAAPQTTTVELDLSGELTIYAVAAHEATLREALHDEVTELRLDLSSTTEVDSAGLQLLLYARHRLESRGGRLVVRTSPAVAELLAFCNLTDLADA